MVETLVNPARSNNLPEMSLEDVEAQFRASSDVQEVPLESRTTFIPFVTPVFISMARKIRDLVASLKLPNTADYNPLE